MGGRGLTSSATRLLRTDRNQVKQRSDGGGGSCAFWTNAMQPTALWGGGGVSWIGLCPLPAALVPWSRHSSLPGTTGTDLPQLSGLEGGEDVGGGGGVGMTPGWTGCCLLLVAPVGLSPLTLALSWGPLPP